MDINDLIKECSNDEMEAIEAGKEWLEALTEDEIVLYFTPVEPVIH